MKEYIITFEDDDWFFEYAQTKYTHFFGCPIEEIVRCRDCTRFVPQGTYRFNGGVVNKDTCDVIRGFVVQIDPDGFCAWAERRKP